jgi:hypothetical protein
MALSGEYLYGALETVDTSTGERQGLLAVADVSDLSDIRFVGRLDLPLVASSTLVPWTVSFSQGIVVVSAGESLIHFVDVTDPTRPVEYASAATVATARGAAVAFPDVYVATGASGLTVLRGYLEVPPGPPLGAPVYLPVALRTW